MFIKYLTVRNSIDSPRLSNRDATTIGATVNQPEYDLGLSLRDTLGILLEQSILADYLLNMNPNSKELQSYRENCKHAITKHSKSIPSLKEKLSHEFLSIHDFNLVYNYIVNKDILVGPSLDTVIAKFFKTGSNYITIPTNFVIPYFNRKEYYDPVILSPVYRTNKEDDGLNVTFYCKHYTSTIIDRTLNIDDNLTMNYICSMNHVGKSWKELVGTIQSLSIPFTGRAGYESLPQVLSNYFRNDNIGTLTDTVPLKKSLLDALRHVYLRDNIELLKDAEDTEELISLFSYLGDNRLQYLTIEDPTVKVEDFWNQQKDLLFLNDIFSTRKPYVMAASDEDDTGDKPDEDDSEDESDDTVTDDVDDDDDTDDESEDDLFSDDDDFSDDSDEEEGSESGSSSSNTTDTSSDDNSENNEEDVNPIIELIEDETFDEYLDRGILNVRIKKLITSPPRSLKASDISFLKYWYLQWFPSVSVATTRQILGNILKIPSKKITTS